MKKSSLFSSIASLAIIALIFTACPQEPEDEGFDDVTSAYPLTDNDSGISTIGKPSNLTAAAKKSKVDGTVYITVTGTLTGVDNFTATPPLWGGKREQAPSGKWADLALDLSSVFTTENAAKVLSIKSANHAFRYYKGADNILSAAPTTPTNGDPNIYIPSSDTEFPIKWKIYDVSTFKLDASHNFGIILWSAAPSKIITLEVIAHTAYADLPNDAATRSPVAKIVIDYSGVTIN
jgi:hypothetical protein